MVIELPKMLPDGFGRNLAIGVASWIMIQAFFNIGGMINIIPMTGVPLPFISYGGTAIYLRNDGNGLVD